MEDAKMILQKAGVLQSNGHFVGTNGEHLSDYLDFDLIYTAQNENIKKKLLENLAQKIQTTEAEAITGPAEGGNLLSASLTPYLSQIRIAKSKKSNGNFVYETEELEKLRGKKIVVVDDVFRTGHSLRKLSTVLKTHDIQPIAFAVMLNRHPNSIEILDNSPILSVFSFPLSSWDETSCPLCLENVPVNTTFGHGQEFLARKK